MKNRYLYLVLSFVSLGVAIVAMYSGDTATMNAVEGSFKGLAGVFFIVFYILMLLRKEPLDKTTH